MLICAAVQCQVDGNVLACQLAEDFSEGLVTTTAATLWHVDFTTDQRIPLLSAHAGTVTSFAASPSDDQLVASTCEDGVLRIWQMTHREVCVAQSH